MREGTEAVGLETLSCEERVQLGRAITLATSNSSPGQERDRGNAASGLIRVVHGWRVRGSSTAETVEIQSIHKEETLSEQKQPRTGVRALAGVTSLGGYQTPTVQPGLSSKLPLLGLGLNWTSLMV